MTATTQWTAGEYTLLADNYTDDETSTEYVRGDRLELDALTAVRFGNLSPAIIGVPGSIEADKAEAKDEESQLRVKVREAESFTEVLTDISKKLESEKIDEEEAKKRRDDAERSYLRKLHQGFPTAPWPGEEYGEPDGAY